MTRLRTFFLFAALLVLATTVAACGGGGDGGGNENAEAVVENATLEGVDSGELDLSLGVDVKGKENGSVDISLSGPFQSEDGASAPKLDMKLDVDGAIDSENIEFAGGLTLLPGKAFVNYEGVDYEVDPTTYSFVESAIKQAQRESEEGGDSSDAEACQEAVAGLDFDSFVDNLSNDGSADVDGVGTTKVSGDLDVSSTVDVVIELVEDPACSAQFDSAGSLPSVSDLEQARSDVQKAVKAAHAELYVGDDDIVRKFAAQLTIEPPEEDGEGPQAIDLDFELTISGVNEDQSISAPSGTKPLSDLFLKLGINPIELAGLLGEGGELNPDALGDLLEGLGGSAGGGSGGGGSSGGSGGGQQAYLKCLQNATTPVDIQRCTSLLQ